MHHVGRCEVEKCAFNQNQKCHAIAVQIGDHKPKCDTFTDTNEKVGLKTVTAEVGACKVTDCSHNKKMICSANSIQVGWVHNRAECINFEMKT